ncbi:MAG TPA: HD domain-containing protein [Candidatus Limnocylindrales bacterium]|nr:HD domain-containing protein [Candidatus Limnocylindrales bacterium]
MARGSARRWWAEKIGRFVGYVRANVTGAERAELATLLTPDQMALFEAMPRADRRHGLDVAGALRRAGYGDDRELILAGLLHDAGKGRTVRLWHRVAWSLGQRYGRWLLDAAGAVPGARPVFERLERHPRISADLVKATGAPARTVELIAAQADPREPAARALHLADEGELDEGPR